jgi:hypothetical protein
MTPATAPATSASGTLASLDPLTALRQDFPAFRIWRETIHDRTRYTACRQQPGLNPHTVITDDLGELRAALEPSVNPAAGPETQP